MSRDREDPEQAILFIGAPEPRTSSIGAQERESQRERMASRRAEGRELEVPDPVDPDRREKYRHDLRGYMLEYFPRLVSKKFARMHEEIIAEAQEVILHLEREGYVGARKS